MRLPLRLRLVLLGALAAPGLTLAATTYHVDREAGNDQQDGRSPATAWATLGRASEAPLGAGDELRLRRGQTFPGSLILSATGSAAAPVVVGAYGEGSRPVIDARGQLAAVELISSRHVVVSGLELTGDGGAAPGVDPKRRFGVFVHTTERVPMGDIVLEDLVIRDLFPAEGAASEGARATTHKGTGIAIHGTGPDSRGFVIRGCHIERVGFKGIELSRLGDVLVDSNRLLEIGGPGIQPGRVEDLIVRRNTVLWTGARTDPRMHARGSGIWPWTSKRVLIERNRFGYARGKADSCGIHIDFGCRDVVVQHNLSHDNEGGFIEILGDCYNSAYRYNVSIRDGARVKGQGGADQEGKIIWTSGYVGARRAKEGPVNSYLYNNTVFVGPGTRSAFSIGSTTEGLIIANNIFVIEGAKVEVVGDQDFRREAKVDQIPRALVSHNLFLAAGGRFPETLPITEVNPVTGNPRLARPGGFGPADHAPRNARLVRDQGMVIEPLPGDTDGFALGLTVATDFLGNPIVGRPDLGAIELPLDGSEPALNPEMDFTFLQP